MQTGKQGRLFIEALLGKWLWQYGVDREAFWRRLILGKYESLGGGWSTKVVNGPYGDTFPELYRTARDKDADVADLLQFHNGSIYWESKMRIRSAWKLAGLRGFEVRSYYRALIPSGAEQFPWKSKWKAKDPPWVAFFTWTVSLGRILTADNLRRRNIILMNWCCMCKVDGESVIICFCIVLWLKLVGKADWDDINTALHGKPSLIVQCGACGGKEMLGPLRDVNGTH
uniref:Reverse transcriptase zinc-binding domain-containing protein n=1 Tax=Fagus sylvatica TaxID=28930 RepID=A0A2N9GKV3_FAGSY